MRIFQIHATQVSEHTTLADFARPDACVGSYLWISLTRDEFAASLPQVQDCLQTLCGTQLVDLHVVDLLNDQLPSQYDFTSQYDVLVMRRLGTVTGADAVNGNVAGNGNGNGTGNGKGAAAVAPGAARVGGPPVLRRIDTRPVGFALFDRVLLSVHPQDGAVRDALAAKLMAANLPTGAPALDARATSTRLPTSPADLMLRVINQIVDAYLALRRDLTRQLDHWQAELIDPKSRFHNWSALMQSRQALRHLDEICDDQRGAMQDWIDSLETLPEPENLAQAREHELLLVRSRDVLEHIQRVAHHVQRLEENAETAVQMHFNIQSHRTNDIMRVLTVLTAVFLPLNLIAGIFGMNFENVPLLHKADGFWIAMGAMAVIAVVLVVVFWRKRYLASAAK